MRKVSYALILLTGLIFLIILALTIAWATFDDEDYRRLAVRSVEAFTGYAMAIDGAFSLDLSTRPILSAEGIRLEARDGDPPPSLSKIGKFYAQLDLPQLIFGHLVVPELQAEDVVLAIAVNDPADAEDTDEGPLLAGDVDLPVFESVRLRNIQLDVTDVANARTIPVRIQWFDMDDVRNTGPIFVSGEGTVGGEEFSIAGRMGPMVEMLKKEPPYAVDYNLTIGGMRFSVAGTFEDYLDAEGADVHVARRLGGEMERAGFSVAGTHVLPRSAWMDYYGPLEVRLKGLLEHDDADVRALAAENLEEIEIFSNLEEDPTDAFVAAMAVQIQNKIEAVAPKLFPPVIDLEIVEPPPEEPSPPLALTWNA